MISDQIAPIEWDQHRNSYRIVQPSAPDFGDEATVDYESAIRLAREYDCKAIEILTPQGEKVTAIGLFPNFDVHDSSAEYVELDDWARPIQISKKSVDAISLVRSLLLHPAEQESLVDAQFTDTLLEGVPPDLPELGIAIFRRTIEYLERRNSQPPASLYALLPWVWFEQHLAQLIKDLRETRGQIEKPSARILPDLGSFFHCVQPRLAPSMRELTEWRTEEIDWRGVSWFISSVWLTNIHLVPDRTRELLFNSILSCAIFLGRENARTRRVLPTRQRGILAQAQVRSMLLLNRIRVARGKAHLHRRLQNLEEALVVAADAGFLSTRVNFLEAQMLMEVKACAAEIPARPEELLAAVEAYFLDPKRRKGDEVPDTTRLNHLLDAAEVCKFAAQISAKLEDDQESAKRLLDKSEPYFARAAMLKLSDGNRSRLHKRWTRKVLLSAEISGSEDAAIAGYKRALELLKNVTTDTSIDVDAAYGNALLRAYALFGIASMSVNTKNQVAEAQQAFKEAVSQSAPEGRFITLLADYYVHIEKNYDAALKVLDEWVLEHQGRDDAEQAAKVNFVRYYAAELCAQASEEVPSWGSDAVARFSAVLRDQPANVAALERLLDVFGRLPGKFLFGAREAVRSNLMAPADPDCPIAHAVGYILCNVPTEWDKGTSASPTRAMATLINGTPSSWAEAAQTLQNAWGVLPHLRNALEIMSKWFFRLGRSIDSAAYLDTAARLLDLALMLDPHDVVWVSRRVDIAVALGSFATAVDLLGKAVLMFPNDPILQLRRAQFELSANRLEQAKEVLERLSASEPGSEELNYHPAVLDSLAFISLRQGAVEKAEAYYRRILERRKFDPRAEFGLGRVQLAKGPAFWPEAFEHWRVALRLQAQSIDTIDRKHAGRTARSIAGLFRGIEKGSSAQADLLERLTALLNEEDAQVSAVIIDSLRQVAVTDRGVLTVVMRSADRATNVRLRRRAAQLLMSSTIDGILKGIASEGDVCDAISWCKHRDVLPEFIAGAKGSYARTLLNLEVQGVDLDAWLIGLRRHASSGLRDEKHWADLIGHVSTTGYVSEYYSTAAKLSGFLSDTPDDVVAAGIRELVVDVGLKIFRDSILDNTVPAVALWRLGDLLKEGASGPSEVAGWVDRELLDLAEYELRNGATVWRLADTRVERGIPRLPREEKFRPLNDGGIFFVRSTDLEGEPHRLYFNVLSDLPESTGQLA